jgi:hypothetical protein
VIAMRCKVLKPFSYSSNGFVATNLVIGDEQDIRDDLAPGLVKEGYVAPLENPISDNKPEPAVTEQRKKITLPKK